MQVNRFMPGAMSASSNDPQETVSEAVQLEAVTSNVLGDCGGALSWPIPLSVTQRSAVLNTIEMFKAGRGDKWGPGQQLLDYLYSARKLPVEMLADPAQALHALIASDEGQDLGLAVQTQLKGVATDVSINEYALAALQISLDSTSIDTPQRNCFAGFDLASRQHWGKPISALFEQLREHLIQGLVCTPEVARLAAYALLARQAPVCLVQSIPDDVRYGGPAWFNLAVAVSIIEAQTPGKVASMTFAQVMLDAQTAAAAADPAVTRHAQTLTLIDWGVVHGLVQRQGDHTYTEAQLSALTSDFNARLVDRLNAPILLKSTFPSRRNIAQAGLEKQFGKDYPIEKPVLEWDSSEKTLAHLAPVPAATFGPVGMYSLLDVAMMDGSWRWKTTDPLLKRRIDEINELDLRVWTTFSSQFETTLNNLKQGARLTVRHLISGLPLEDRENLEYGKITFYQHKTFRLSTQFWGRDLRYTSTGLTLRVERGSHEKVTVYHIDLAAGSISRKETDPATETDRYDVHVPSIVYATTSFSSADKTLAAKFEHSSRAMTVAVPVSYSSVRTAAIADVFVEHLDYDSDDILQAARGQTTYDNEIAVLKSRLDFLLNLIPFKSAITNFIGGKYADGAIDLFLDVLGFVTAGVSVAAKLTQVAARTATVISKALKAAKIIGMLVISELNPLSAVLAGGQLLGRGIRYLGVSGLQQFKRLRGAAPAYDMLLGLSKQHGPAAMGSFKVGEQSFDAIGVLKDGKWFPYNNETRRLYGAPSDFRPSGTGGFANDVMGRLAVKPSSIAGLEANAQGIFRSADGEHFYIRNIDAAGKEAVFRIRNDFTLGDDVTDVILVDRVTNRTHGSRLRQVAPDQWQPLSLRGGDLPSSVADYPAAIVDETADLASRITHTSTNPLSAESVFTRERLPNGLWDPIIEAVDSRQTAHLTGDWGQVSQVPYTFQRTGIHQALSTPELSRVTVTTSLMQPGKVSYSADIASQIRNKEGGANFIFVMERIKPADSLGGQINALKIHDPKVDKLPEQANAVLGYWAPQGGYVDIPIHPAWGEPDHLFTADFGGCALVADQMDANRLRIRHVEGAKELAQYNGLARADHGWGQSMSMEFHDYGLRVNDKGQADAILTGFAFMKYDRTALAWKLHFQSSQGAATIARHSSAKPAWGTRPDTLVALCSTAKVSKVVTRPVTTIPGAVAG